MSKEDVSRETLYEQVWREPMTSLGKKYGVSSSYLARVCTSLNVPRPERGYWSKLAAGHKVPVFPLPAPTPDHDLVWCRSGIIDPTKNVVKPKPLKSHNRRTKRRSPIRDGSPHPLIRSAKDLFLRGRETGNGYLKPFKWNLVDIITSEQKLDRALCIANTLFQEFENRGWAVRLEASTKQFQRPQVDDRPQGGKDRYDVNHWSPGRSTLVYLESVVIGLTLIENSHEVEVVYTDGKHVPVTDLKKSQRWMASRWPSKQDRPSGQFRLRAYSPYLRTSWQKEWTIRDAQDLSRFAKTVARELRKATTEISEEFAVASEQIRREREEWARQREKWRIEQDNKIRQEAVTESTKALEGIIAEWGRFKRIHEFFDELETAIGHSSEEDKALLHERLRSARALARIPDVLEVLKAWKTPEEIYDAKKPRN
ncbi:hypothetical protein J3362_06635 [Marinobacter sp. NFXS11]|uniref:hypothetical protein n=1 Tax=Marinobacter sp. NFXS11 TaxID=2818432 RepID=UPI0032DE933A